MTSKPGNGASRYVLWMAILSIAAASCGMPRDPESTLDRVTGGTLRVGVIAHDPWVVVDGSEPEGVEVELVKAFAEEIDAQIEWFPASESESFAALHLGELDLVIGGISSTSPFSKEGALTHPYLTTQTVVGFPGEPGIEPEIEGLEVAVEKGSAAAGLLEKTDALPVTVEDVTTADGPRVVENWMLDGLGLIDLGVQLEEVDHVMAVRLGENAFMVKLERFLLDSADLVASLLEEAQP